MEAKQTNYIYALTNDTGQCPEEVKILPVGTVNSEKVISSLTRNLTKR